MTLKPRRETGPRKGGSKRPARLPFAKYDSSTTPIWEFVEGLAAQVPDSEWQDVPHDLARNVHHYLHGGRKDEGE